MLRDEETIGDFETTPEASGETASDTGDPNLGRRIGPYRIEHLLARGGMGIVYLAVREDDFRQRVALKLVQPELRTAEVLERFAEERQILAQLEHPHIARILDGGTTDDALPFFVMEYVPGRPIDRYCDERRLTLRQRLELFCEVCSAAHYAHQNLVVHRDLKPSNILVTAEGVPKLVDFGIAKILDARSRTASSRQAQPPERVMTFSYASPEQIRDQAITTASDVYSLGVLLYRLASGRHPYHTALGDSALMARMICEEEPPPPSSLVPRRQRRRITGDVDAIVAKAMRKEPRARYASALQLAEDLERQLADRPVEAHQGSWLYRLGKFARRHKLGLAAIVVIVALAIQATVLWRRSEHRLVEVEREHLRAERISDFLVGLWQTADPDAAQGRELTVREALDHGRRKLASELVDEPEVRAELMTTLGTVYNNLALYREARELKEEALRSRLAADPSDRPELAADLNNLGRLLYDLGDYPAAADYFRQALAMWRRLGNDDHAVFGLRNLAAARLHSGHPEEALELYRQALDLQRRRLGPRDPEIAESLYGLAVLHRARGEPEAAEPLLRQALEIFSASYGPRHTRVAAVASSLGRVLHDQGRLPEARRSFEQALELRLELLGEDHVHVANTRKNLAALLLDQGDVEGAGELLEAALASLRRTKPAGNWTIADAESIRGSHLTALGRYAEAEGLVLDSYRILREVKGDGDANTRAALQRVIDLYEAWGREDEAAAYRAALVPPSPP